MALATIPGYPRIGKRRELKRALEGYWSGKRSAAELEEIAAGVRRGNWETQMAAGLDLVPVNDFSFYDHVLDTSALVGAVPERFGWDGRGRSTSISSSPWRVAVLAPRRRTRRT